MATDMPVCFCDPASPWQRGLNEDTNVIPRQYVPKSAELSIHVPASSNESPTNATQHPTRKTLDWDTPAERLARLIAAAAYTTCCNGPWNPPLTVRAFHLPGD